MGPSTWLLWAVVKFQRTHLGSNMCSSISVRRTTQRGGHCSTVELRAMATTWRTTQSLNHCHLNLCKSILQFEGIGYDLWNIHKLTKGRVQNPSNGKVPPFSAKEKSVKNWPKNSVFWAKNAVFSEFLASRRPLRGGGGYPPFPQRNFC